MSEEFVGRDLRGARFVESDLSGVVMRGVDIAGADIDAPWITDGDSTFWINGVDVAPLVEAELSRRLPGRADRRAQEPDALRDAWASVERAWAGALERVATMPAGTVDVSVAGEWSFAQTLRHLVMATDIWLGKAVLEREHPFHPIGLPDATFDGDAADFNPAAPAYAEVLEVRAGRVAMVRDFLATVTQEDLAVVRTNPHNASRTETTLHCVLVILEEEWEHLRFATRDLDTIASSAESAASPTGP